MPRDRRLGSTVRFRVTLLATAPVIVVLVTTSVLLVARQRSSLLELLDEALQRDADRISNTLEEGAGAAEAADDDDDLAVRVVADDGTLLASTDEDVDGGRIATSDFSAPDGTEGEVIVAASVEDVDESVAALVPSLLWIVPLAVIVLAGVVWAVVGRTLRPVEQIRREVAGIGLHQLDRRVPQPSGNDEIARLATTMNEMLDRLERSSRRQQQFVADASHELRTPLTRMRSELEVGSATPKSLLEELVAQQAMIEDLLLLARSDSNALETRRDVVDLDDVVMEEVSARRSSEVAIDTSAVSAAQVRGHAEQLRRIVRNLLDNAVRHASTAVRIELGERGHQAVLAVTDDGPGIPPDRRDEIFERFTRLDSARSGGAGRAGLGLAIAHDLVTRHDGRIAVDGGGAGARFVVTLPLAAVGLAAWDGEQSVADGAGDGE